MSPFLFLIFSFIFEYTDFWFFALSPPSHKMSFQDVDDREEAHMNALDDMMASMLAVDDSVDYSDTKGGARAAPNAGTGKTQTNKKKQKRHHF